MPELVSFKLPMLPSLSKQTIPYIGALIGYALRDPKRLRRLPSKRGMMLVFGLYLVGGIGVAVTNQDPVTVGS